MKRFEVIFAKREQKGVENHYENGFLRMGFRGIENPYKTCGKLMILGVHLGVFWPKMGPGAKMAPLRILTTF